MFESRLFSIELINKEINAINSEYMKNLYNDDWRESQVMKNISNNKTPFSYFTIGNIETLNNIPKKLGIDIYTKMRLF
jgi:insulysin